MDVRELRKLFTAFSIKLIEEKGLSDWWRQPLLATAVVDERFELLPEVAAPDHMPPKELLVTCQAVVVFFVPFTAEVVNSNAEGKFASEVWGQTLSPTNNLIEEISEFICASLAKEGYKSAVTPPTYNFDKKSLTSRWSHKHLAYIAGLGRFGVNAQLITPSGCAGRLGSLVTEAPLGDHPLIREKELCLHKAGKACMKCIQTCPVRALSFEGIDRHRCDARIQINRKRFAARSGMSDDIEVCAKCVAGMPCSLRAPI